MTKKTVWDYYADIKEFSTQSLATKLEIIDIMLDPDTELDYHYGWAAADIIEYVDGDIALEFAKKMFQLKWPREEYIAKVMCGAHKFDDNKTIIQKMLCEAKPLMFKRMLLTLDNLSVANEEIGLRALARIKNPPHVILEARYCPTLDALKKLPPITRLEALECLICVRLHGYNIFNRITNREEFKNLLFGAAFKYQARVEKVWNKYLELTCVGKPCVITVKANCPSCGTYEVQITNSVIHNADALGKTKFSRIARESCAICGAYLGAPPTIVFGD